MHLCFTEATGSRLSKNIFALTFGLALITASPLAAQEGCQVVFDAMDKVMKTPVHIYSTTGSGGRTQTTETIYLGDDIYTTDKGKWTHSAIKIEQVKQKDQQDRRRSTYNCTHLKDELIDGDVIAQYKTHSVILDQKSDSEIWVSKSTGLLVKNEVDTDAGSKGGKMHYSVRYDYKDVKAPKM